MLNIYFILLHLKTKIFVIKTPYSEDQLIVLLKDRNENGFHYLYDHYSGALYGVILRIVQSKDYTEEIIQDVFVKIWNSIHQYDSSKGRFYTWMINIARNQAIDKTRSKNFKNSSQNSSLEDSVYVSETVPSAGASVDTMDVQNWLLHLPEENRQLMRLAYFMGYTQEEISKELNMPLGTVKTKIRNSLIVLRKKLNVT